MVEGRRRVRWALRLPAALIVATLIAAAAGFPVYVRPQVDELRRADAILVVGGPGYLRYDYGFWLAGQGFAPNLVLSNPNGDRDPWLVKQCATPRDGFRIHCFLPDPATTRGEGRSFRTLAAENGWRTVIVVTIRPHISRARYILAQCFEGELIMAPGPGRMSAADWVYEYLYQTAGYVRAVLDPGC